MDWDSAQAWNKTASERWSRLHRTAYQRVQRELGLTPWVLTRVFEMQHRGVLHVHPVLAYGTYAERRAADRYFELVTDLAPHYGFGYSERKRQTMPARAAAAYLSAYFVTGKKEKVNLQISVMAEGMPRSIVHVSVRLTQKTGCTMRELRFRRFVWRLANRCSCELAEARTIALLAVTGELDLTVDSFTPSPRMLARVVGRTPPPAAGRHRSAPVNRPAPITA